MEDRLRRNISSLARYMNLRSLVRLSGQRTIFPFYHTVSGAPLPHIRHLYSPRNEKEFEADLDEMLKYFYPIAIEDYLQEADALSGTRRKMVLSFDDGLLECHRFIAPLLRKKGVPAIFFLNNDFIDNRGIFFKYRASLLIEHLHADPSNLNRAAEYLSIPEEQVVDAILMINWKQLPLLDALSGHLEFDAAAYLKEHPVYMSTEQLKDLVKWGFHLGAHSTDHPEFYRMEEKEMILQVHNSIRGLKESFQIHPACFAFPFTSDGVPEPIIDQLLEEGTAEVIFGTSGLKKTGRAGFIQRIPMETLGQPAKNVLKTEYLYYLMKAPFGRNRYFKAR